ncbi:MAG: EFR1 family ferrodoxin [Clostridium sp.]|nr:EFR1 family ferrodoxin [Clostridium sp.]
MAKVIYYFSGTGNSMRSAEKIAMKLHDTNIISMRCNASEVSALDAKIVGLIFPVYHWTLPKAVIHFIEELDINPNAYVFAVSMPSFINGKCMNDLSDILHKKGISLSYGKAVYSVANYVAKYPPIPNPQKRVPKTEKLLDKIAEDVSCKTVNKYPNANFLEKLLFHILMPKHIEQLHELDKYFHATEDCISCGICSKVCPCNNIEMKEGTPIFKHKCNQCMACISYCPKGALNYKHSTYKRKKYHNPYILSKDISLNKKYIE